MNDNTGELLRGLVGLSQAIRQNRMAGHPPAAVIAAHFFCHENHLDSRTRTEVLRWVEHMVSGSDSIWFRNQGQPVTNEVLFTDNMDGVPDEKLIPTIADALAPSITECRDSGHNTIFASLALKALHAMPDYAFPSIIEGIVRLLHSFEGRSPGRAHVPGKEEMVDPHEFPSPADLVLPPYDSEADMIAAICQYVVPANFTRRGLGGPIHVINHAVGLLDLHGLGYTELSRQGWSAHHQHLKLWLSIPPFPKEEDRYGTPSQYDPRSYAYWETGIRLRDRGGYEHRLKFLYGAFRLAGHIHDVDMRQAFLSNASHLF